MKSAEIRSAFLNFFKSKGHEIVPSSSLVPGNDPTLLFTNAGMVQFKDVFLGAEKRAYTRATSSQRCVRAGGKHNDLENVGYTARHHTFFEMLGNFSFGDYFKKDAIHFGWEFLTSREWMAIPADKLLVTVYADDDEAYDIWHNDIGLPAEKIIRIGDNKGAKYASDNFWAMGDTGPCGPCTEIFYDHGDNIWGGPPGSAEEDGDRFIEIWNIVFMQFNRSANGDMASLPKPSVDTGMGLERIAAVKQDVHSNYEIDLFQNLLKAAAEVTGAKDLDSKSLRVIADHIRSCAFLIVDGVLPSNEGRGYVLRRIIRRALRHGNKLGCEGLFFGKLVPALVTEMGEAYPELAEKATQVERVLEAEEEQFARTLDTGLAVLESAIDDLGDSRELPGELVFKLHDTYGFPTDLTNDIARERDLTLDMAGFDKCMAQQRRKSQDASKFGVDYSARFEREGETLFAGYDGIESKGKVIGLLLDGNEVEQLEEGQSGMVVLDQTAFYAESGGQVGDSGVLESEGVRFEVVDCQKQSGHHLHRGQLVSGTLRVGDTLDTRVDASIRQATALNHSATHLLHAALRQVLGDHVSQQGSLVNSQRLRFDFTHMQAVKPEELRQIEHLVNREIRRNTEVQVENMSMDDAMNKGAMALFSEKYGDQVRVLTMGGDFSIELCGGTHVQRTGDIGLMKIVSESGVASGVRRIEAVTGAGAETYLENLEQQLATVADALKTTPQNLAGKAQQMAKINREQEREIEQLKMKLANSSGSDLSSQAVEVNGIKLLATKLDGMDPKNLRALVDQMKNKLGSAVVVIGTANEGKVALVCGVTKDLTDRVQAGKLLAHVAEQVGGKGGGRPDMAQGGGNQPENLDKALDSVHSWLESN
ncbi:MAG: alanine--tRNA ligase [Porticoccaceae bacterium]